MNSSTSSPIEAMACWCSMLSQAAEDREPAAKVADVSIHGKLTQDASGLRTSCGCASATDATGLLCARRACASAGAWCPLACNRSGRRAQSRTLSTSALGRLDDAPAQPRTHATGSEDAGVGKSQNAVESMWRHDLRACWPREMLTTMKVRWRARSARRKQGAAWRLRQLVHIEPGRAYSTPLSLHMGVLEPM
jgi:hypothetical protein